MNSKEIKVLIFKVDGEYYATDIMEVQRILGAEVPTKLPDLPKFVEGVINYEGNILPVISMAKRFNLKQAKYDEDYKIIVVKQKEYKIGIIVDVVSEVRDVNMDNIEEPPDIVAGISKRYLKGLIKNNNKIVIFLNLANILTEQEKQKLL